MASLSPRQRGRNVRRYGFKSLGQKGGDRDGASFLYFTFKKACLSKEL